MIAGARSLELGNGWTLRSFRWVRTALGVYLAIHFAHLVPWGAELFSSEGMLGRADHSPLARVLPNVLTHFDTPGAVAGLLVVGTVLSILFAIGSWRGEVLAGRWLPLVLWYLWACLQARNPLIGNPGLPYVGWMLLGHALVLARPRGEAWRFPPDVFAAAWILMVLGYTYSGATKLASPSWLDGSALRWVLENPLARDGLLREWLLAWPEPFLRVATWGVLALELLALPLALSARARPWLWAALLGLHLTLLPLLDFADLTWGMVLLHAFTADPAWFDGFADSLRNARTRGRIPRCPA